MKDIQSKEDIIKIVDSFYQKTLSDSEIGFIFLNHMSDTLEHHKPTIYNFWSSVLLNNGEYKGNPILTHVNLNKKVKIKERHFNQWIYLWHETIDQLFTGPTADEAKSKALLMKDLMLLKLRQSENPNFIA